MISPIESMRERVGHIHGLGGKFNVLRYEIGRLDRGCYNLGAVLDIRWMASAALVEAIGGSEDGDVQVGDLS
jgi:hypothetical protein